VCPPKVGRFPTQESPLTVAFRTIVMTLAIAMFVVSRPMFAQSGSTSLTHTVSVTVQPRVKVVVRNVATQPGAPVAGSATLAGLAVSVSATRPWTLLIGSPSGNDARSSQTLSGSVVEASISTGGAAPSKPGSQDDGAVMLTIVAP